jgi:carbamoyl-phosphate synthase large subunit
VVKPRLIFVLSVAELGIWEKYGVKIVGVDMAAIEKTENREAFRQLMVDIGVGVANFKNCQLVFRR